MKAAQEYLEGVFVEDLYAYKPDPARPTQTSILDYEATDKVIQKALREAFLAGARWQSAHHGEVPA